MKKAIFILLTLFVVLNASAQYDERFYHPEKEWIDIKFSSYEDITFVSDADTVHSVLIKPEGKAKATVVYFHGNGSNLSKWQEHIRPLVEDGYQVCMMDYRGYGKSTGTPKHLNIESDARKLFDILMERRDVKKIPVIIYGASIGSQVASKLALDNNDKVSALVLDGAMASFTDVALLGTPEAMRVYVEKYVPSPYSAKESLPALKGIKVLLIHSEADPIPIADARKMYDSIECEKEFWLYEGEHVMAPVKYPAEFVGYMNSLLEK